jgi:hypothetical protein
VMGDRSLVPALAPPRVVAPALALAAGAVAGAGSSVAVQIL